MTNFDNHDFPPRGPNAGVSEAIRKLGSQERLAAMMDVNQSTISIWLHRGPPVMRAIQLASLTGVSLGLFRPDIVKAAMGGMQQ